MSVYTLVCALGPGRAAMISIAVAWCTHAGAAGAQGASDPFARHRSVYRMVEQDRNHYRRAEAGMDTLGLEPQSTEGGLLTAYCEGIAIRLLVAEYYGETGDVTERFYFDRDSLLFVFRQRRRGIPDEKNPYPRRTIFEEERFYFDGARLARWLGPGNQSKNVLSSAAKTATQNLTIDARRLRAAMPECKPKYASP